MAAKLTRLTNKMAIRLNLVAESCTTCSSSCRQPVRELLETLCIKIPQVVNSTSKQSWWHRAVLPSFSTREGVDNLWTASKPAKIRKWVTHKHEIQKKVQLTQGLIRTDKPISSPPRPERLWGPPSLLSNEYQGLYPWAESGRGVNLTTHLHLVPRSKNAWSYTFTPQYTFMARCLVKHMDNFTFLPFTKSSSGLWRRVVLSRWMQHGLLKRWYPTTTLHGVTQPGRPRLETSPSRKTQKSHSKTRPGIIQGSQLQTGHDTRHATWVLEQQVQVWQPLQRWALLYWRLCQMAPPDTADVWREQ
jgi:hypothetical protein